MFVGTIGSLPIPYEGPVAEISYQAPAIGAVLIMAVVSVLANLYTARRSSNTNQHLAERIDGVVDSFTTALSERDAREDRRVEDWKISSAGLENALRENIRVIGRNTAALERVEPALDVVDGGHRFAKEAEG